MVIDVLPSFIINHIGLAQNQNWQSTKDMDMFLSVGGVQDQSIWNKLEMRHSIPDLVMPNSSSPSRSKSLTGTRRKSTTSSKNIKTYLKRGSSLDTSTTVQYNAKTQHTWDLLSYIYDMSFNWKDINSAFIINIFCTENLSNRIDVTMLHLQKKTLSTSTTKMSGNVQIGNTSEY